MCSNCFFCRIAESFDIPVYNFSTTNKKAFTVVNTIVIDFKRIETGRECKRLFAEELGHCIIGANYSLSDCCDGCRTIAKAENKAIQYAYKLLVPLPKLKKIIKSCNDDFEIAEMLDVDIDTLREAVEYYRIKKLLE